MDAEIYSVAYQEACVMTLAHEIAMDYEVAPVMIIVAIVCGTEMIFLSFHISNKFRGR